MLGRPQRGTIPKIKNITELKLSQSEVQAALLKLFKSFPVSLEKTSAVINLTKIL